MRRFLWLSIFLAVLVWSAINPHDYPTWALEVLPAILVLIVIVSTYKRFPLTSLLYILILVHAVVLMIGGHFTYALVPWFDWLWDLIGSERNNYDKIGHFMQGFVPAIAAREFFIRFDVVRGRVWMNLIIVLACLGVSAFYELLEWWVALISGEAAEAFLGTQGYVWDTQSDMAWAMFAAMIALILLSGLHDVQLTELDDSK